MDVKNGVILFLLGLTQVTTAFNPCSNYKTLNAANRLITFTGQSPVRCDQRDITPGWYRFTGVAGNPVMPTQCPSVRRCGTHAPGWIRGQHPSVADGEVTREVCYHWSNNCCRWKNNIKVKNCGAFYVYELQRTPACSLRYCVESNNPCTSYKNLNAADRLITFTGQSPVRCDQRDITPGWYRFTGVAGNPVMPTQCPSVRRCGTHAPGWIRGQHPSVADGEVTREVCYHWSNNCCRWKNNIKVKNCGAFYVYELQKTPACSLRYCVAANDPCSSYKNLNAADRLITFTGQSPVRCDQRDINPGWYRFTGVAGKPQMPTQCPSVRRCGTHAPGWIRGQHPSVADGEVTREVCYHWSNNCCRWKNNIKVKNCGAFYVYELQKTPACSLRYCAAANDPCSSYKNLNAADRLITFTGQSPVRCDQRDITPGWYRFTGVAGKPKMPTQCPSVRRCGTHAPGWIRGQHPSVADGEVTREVCYHWSSNCCRWKNNIKVKNCGAFYVYELQKTPVCSLRYCAAANDPCSNYKNLDAANRLITFTGQSPVRCDQRDISPGWYRFTGVAGNPQMPTQCPSVRRCGTHAPGWIRGQHPSVADGEVTREVCYHWSSNCCRWKNNIKVKNCGAFYVYELQKTPACSLRYCVAANDPCSSYKNLNAANRLITFTGQSPVRCDQRDITPGWYRFTGVAGNPVMPTQCPSVRRCGTHAPGWIRGHHPSVADGEVTREVCYHWSNNCCQWKNNIKVKNCGAFYVYELQKTPACSLRYCVVANDPCSNYKNLNAANRLVTFTGQSPVRCDQRDITPGWYRFTGVAGNPKMPTQCPSVRRCGTHAPGWIRGQHPSVADGEVTREVCYHWSNNCCQWKNNIKVKNCGAFYVYELQKTPACSLRYCAVP